MKTEISTYLTLRYPDQVGLKLCYVDADRAYFTSDMAKQWGDDWNDAPYEHNAGEPYDRDTTVFVVKIQADHLSRPCDECNNSPYSVEMINNRRIPWLRMSEWYTADYESPAGDPVALPGDTLLQFIANVRKAGGEVFLPVGSLV